MESQILLERAKESAKRGEKLDRQSILELLKLDPDSDVVDSLGKIAKEVSFARTGGNGHIWSVIGVDYDSCPMNCSHCSFGEKWGIVKKGHELRVDEVIEIARMQVRKGARWIVLRTTEFYSLDKLTHLVREIRKAIPGDYEIAANVGELDNQKAEALVASGIQCVYHTLRLREGIDTNFRLEERLGTLEAIKNSALKLVYLIEPVGEEHSGDELADVFLTGLGFGAEVTGAMARVPVEGTPFGGSKQITERRLAQIIAITRLASGNQAPDICVHPPSQLALDWGANVLVVETGAVPRDHQFSENEWNGFTIDTAKDWLETSGYKMNK